MELKTKDLKQNNLILYNDKIITVRGTVGNTIYYKGDAGFYFDSNVGESYQPFKPITLTEEKLIEFGFNITQGIEREKDFRFAKKYYKKGRLDYEFVLTQHKTQDFWLFSISTDLYTENHVFVKLSEVHKLQNFWYEMTDEELTLTQQP